jgi:hypothetical protein
MYVLIAGQAVKSNVCGGNGASRPTSQAGTPEGDPELFLGPLVTSRNIRS